MKLHEVKTQNTDDPNPLIPTFSTAIPVTTKVGMGFRYFFNQNIGFNLATSLGYGGTINGGLTIKLK